MTAISVHRGKIGTYHGKRLKKIKESTVNMDDLDQRFNRINHQNVKI